jgi:hypothetical protein
MTTRPTLNEWLADLRENGDDGSGYCDLCSGCSHCEVTA